jgi:peptidoglycan/LPS O-acetylase OafA/YrhL
MSSHPYRPDIDGLRAVAVLFVLIFHAFPERLPGGFIGVDIFFVISGFLITGIIRDQRAEGRFSLANFYERRIRRIFPALVLVLASTFVAGWFLFLPTEFAELGTNTIAGAAFFANVALLLQSGYFDIEASKKPLLHLWSLGIEEQFYIAWPLLLMLASRFRNGVVWMIAAVGVASFALNLFLIAHHPEATFYLPFTRAWELLSGAFLAYTRLEWRKLREITALLGLVLISVAAFKLTAKAEFPGWRAALPVAGTALLIASPGSFLNYTFLENSLLVRIGLISYPLYLWHWPLLVFAPKAIYNLNDTKRAIILAACFGLAWATYRFVEKPIRTGRYGSLKAASAGLAMASISAFGVWTVYGAGLTWRFPAEIRSILGMPQQADRWRVHQCMLLTTDTEFSDACNDQRRPLVFLWGDSTSGALMPGLLDLQQKRNFGIAQFNISSCEPVLTEAVDAHCRDMNGRVLDVLAKTQPQIVLLQAIWYPTTEHLDGLVATINDIRKLSNPHIVVLGRVPVWEGGIKQHILNYYTTHLRTLPNRLPQTVKEKWYDTRMRERLEPIGVTFISAWDAMCNPIDGCVVRVPNKQGEMDIVATDILHLSEAGSAYLINAIQNKILPP